MFIRQPAMPFWILALVCWSPIQSSFAEDAPQLADPTLIAFYDFKEGTGDRIQDKSGHRNPAHLKIESMSAVKWIQGGGLEVTGKARIQSVTDSVKLVDALGRTGEFSIEIWLTSSGLQQKGPARIVTCSADSNTRNFTVGQENDQFQVRFRTTETSMNGLPGTNSNAKSLNTKLTHFVFTRDRGGKTRIFRDGDIIAQSQVNGGVNNWDGYQKIILADEANGGRNWQGTYFLIAIFNRALQPNEVKTNFNAGHLAPRAAKTKTKSPSMQLFEMKSLESSQTIVSSAMTVRHAMETWIFQKSRWPWTQTNQMTQLYQANLKTVVCGRRLSPMKCLMIALH